jgi:hypothetical protein
VVKIKNRKPIIGLLLISIFGITHSISTNSVIGSSGVYTISQPFAPTHIVHPIERANSAAAFYDYWSASAHTPFVQASVSKIYLYHDTTSGELSLIMHHGMDNEAATGMAVQFNLQGVPAGAYTALSDDNAAEFSLTKEPEGTWRHGHNSDGGIVGGLPTDTEWCIVIDPELWTNINGWHYQLEGDVIPLNMQLPLIICREKPTPGPLFSEILFMLPLGILVGTLIIRRRR